MGGNAVSLIKLDHPKSRDQVQEASPRLRLSLRDPNFFIHFPGFFFTFHSRLFIVCLNSKQSFDSLSSAKININSSSKMGWKQRPLSCRVFQASRVLYDGILTILKIFNTKNDPRVKSRSPEPHPGRKWGRMVPQNTQSWGTTRAVFLGLFLNIAAEKIIYTPQNYSLYPPNFLSFALNLIILDTKSQFCGD